MIVVDTRTSSRVATITIDREERRNALDRETATRMTNAIEELSLDEALRAVVITGAGNTFSAGADLAALEALQTASHEENVEDSRAVARLFEAVRLCELPVVARVNGHAIAGGFGLVTACDFAICDKRARFGFPEVRIGFIPAIVMTLLKNRLPDLALRRLLLTGGLISADEACGLGLVNRAVDAGELDGAVSSLTDEIARETSRQAIAATKSMLFELDHMDPGNWTAYAVDENARMRRMEDCLAGVRAFLEKEDPPWKKALRPEDE